MKLYLKMLRLQHHLLAVPPLLGILDSGVSLKTHPEVVFFVLGWFLSSITEFFHNDYIDSFDTDKFSADRRASRGKKINKMAVFVVVVFLTIFAWSLFFLGGGRSFGLGLVTYFLMISYSLPPIRLKKKRYLDILTQVVAWAVIPYFAPFYLSGTAVTSLVPFLFMISFLTAAAAIAPILDISADFAGGIFNTTVAWGYEKSIRLSSRLMLLALTLGLILVYQRTNRWYYLMLPPGFMAMKVLGMGQANSDRPKKLEAIFLRAKKWAKFVGSGLFIVLAILIIKNNL